uniref:Uncharacterized protein n=1 Tax=viral metagenome TaxID=1070528 RepID=A0A6M3IMP9_9ZZZZ
MQIRTGRRSPNPTPNPVKNPVHKYSNILTSIFDLLVSGPSPTPPSNEWYPILIKDLVDRVGRDMSPFANFRDRSPLHLEF